MCTIYFYMLIIQSLAACTCSASPKLLYHDIIHTCYYPAHMRRGKVIGSVVVVIVVVVVVVVDTKIA